MKLHRSPFSRSLLALVAVVVAHAGAGAERTAKGGFVDDPTTQFRPVLYANAGQLDYLNDQQTGTRESDLVGDAAHPVFYIRFDDANTPSLTDGTLGFRVRVGGDPSPPGFKANFFIGLDANLDGRLDLFLGVHNQGSNNNLAIWSPGAGANLSPNTTSIVSPPMQTYAESAANYHFSPVNATIDPTATDFDLFNDGADQFLSFSIPFADVVARLSGIVPGFNQGTPVSYVIATATQDNALNQDIGGVRGGVNSNLTYGQLGAISNPTTSAVPEPSSLVMLGAGLVGLAYRASRSRRRRRTAG